MVIPKVVIVGVDVSVRFVFFFIKQKNEKKSAKNETFVGRVQLFFLFSTPFDHIFHSVGRILLGVVDLNQGWIITEVSTQGSPGPVYRRYV